MRGEQREIKQKPRKRKKTHRVYAALVLTLGIVIICLTLLILFYVQRIEIKGNEYCSDQEIAEAIQNDRYSINTLYVAAKYAMGKGELPAAVEAMDVKLKNPWTLSVAVEEKTIVGYIQKNKKRVYFDQEGMVVLYNYRVIEDIPQIKGIQFKNIKLYHQLQCDNPKVFSLIHLTTQELKKQELSAKKILVTGNRIYAYIGKTCVSFGTEVTAEKVAQIQPILEKLKKKKGTLHLENYSAGNDTITFAIGEFPKEN